MAATTVVADYAITFNDCDAVAIFPREQFTVNRKPALIKRTNCTSSLAVKIMRGANLLGTRLLGMSACRGQLSRALSHASAHGNKPAQKTGLAILLATTLSLLSGCGGGGGGVGIAGDNQNTDPATV